MDDLFGFLFTAAFVVFIVYLVAMFATMVLVNAYVLLDPVLAGFAALPAPLAWGVTSGVFVALLHFACAESPKLRRPGLGSAVTAAAVSWLGLAWLVGLIHDNTPATSHYTQARQPVQARAAPRPTYNASAVTAAPSRPPRRDPNLYETAYVNTQKLNVRRGPGTQFDVVDTVGKGALVRIFERRQAGNGGPWVRMRAGTAEGWVSEAYLRTSASSRKTSSRAATDTPAPGSRARVATTLLNVRAGPGVDNTVVGRVARGTLLRVLDRRRVDDDAIWIRVQTDAVRGWVNARFVEVVR